jgi:hypothetical protein
VLVLIAHGNERGQAATGRRRAETRVLLREPVRQLRRGRVITVDGQATLRIVREHVDVGR